MRNRTTDADRIRILDVDAQQVDIFASDSIEHLSRHNIRAAIRRRHHGHGDERKRGSGHDAEEIGAREDEGIEEVSELDLRADVRFETGGAVGPHHEPDFQGAEASGEAEAPVAVVDYGAGVGEGVAEIGGGDGEGGGEGSAGFDKETAVRRRRRSVRVASGMECLVDRCGSVILGGKQAAGNDVPCINVHQQPFGHVCSKAVEERKMFRQMLILFANQC